MLQLYVRLLYVKLRLLRVTGTSTVLWWLATTVHDFMYQGGCMYSCSWYEYGSRDFAGRFGLDFSMAVVAVPFILYLATSTFLLFQIIL